MWRIITFCFMWSGKRLHQNKSLSKTVLMTSLIECLLEQCGAMFSKTLHSVVAAMYRRSFWSTLFTFAASAAASCILSASPHTSCISGDHEVHIGWKNGYTIGYIVLHAVPKDVVFLYDHGTRSTNLSIDPIVFVVVLETIAHVLKGTCQRGLNALRLV